MSNRFERCRHCHAVVLYADRDVLGDVAVTILLDPYLLDPAGQVAAVVAGRPLYRHGVEAGQHVVGTGHRAAAGRWLGGEDGVVTAHACGARLGGRHVASLARKPPAGEEPTW